jgi:hypothetical protein
VSTPNILAKKSEEGPLPYCKTEAKLDGYNQPYQLVRKFQVLDFYCIFCRRKIEEFWGRKAYSIKGHFEKSGFESFIMMAFHITYAMRLLIDENIFFYILATHLLEVLKEIHIPK